MPVCGIHARTAPAPGVPRPSVNAVESLWGWPDADQVQFRSAGTGSAGTGSAGAGDRPQGRPRGASSAAAREMGAPPRCRPHDVILTFRGSTAGTPPHGDHDRPAPLEVRLSDDARRQYHLPAREPAERDETDERDDDADPDVLSEDRDHDPWRSPEPHRRRFPAPFRSAARHALPDWPSCARSRWAPGRSHGTYASAMFIENCRGSRCPPGVRARGR